MSPSEGVAIWALKQTKKLGRYWDEIEVMKLDDLAESAVFDADTGFGGDGAGGYIQDGPFVNVTVNIGPGYQTTPTCLARSINRRANPLNL